MVHEISDKRVLGGLQSPMVGPKSSNHNIPTMYPLSTWDIIHMASTSLGWKWYGFHVDLILHAQLGNKTLHIMITNCLFILCRCRYALSIVTHNISKQPPAKYKQDSL